MSLAAVSVMLIYWILWMAGCKLPGVGERPFRGWLYLNDDPSSSRLLKAKRDGSNSKDTPK